MNRLDINKKMTQWALDQVQAYAKCKRGRFEPESFFLSRNCFLVTAMFNQQCIRAARSEDGYVRGMKEMASYSHFYNLVCRRSLGRDYHNRPDEQKPFCIAALDAKGSRYWRTMNEVQDLHVHGLFVMPGIGGDALFQAREKALASPQCMFREIDIVQYDPRKQDHSLERLLSYLQKFSSFNGIEATIQNDTEIFPRRASSQRTAA